MSTLTSEKITGLIRYVQSIPVVACNSATQSDDNIALRQPQRNSNTYYLTTAINYMNGAPHIGHAYEAITSDCIARYNRIYGRETYFLTGADEHGQKIARTAEAQGKTPLQLCDENVVIFKELLKVYNISNDQYIRTTDPRHEAQCQQLWLRSLANGDIYLGTYVGWYNTREETYVTETEAAKTNYCDPTTNAPLDRQEEASYFFRLSKYQDRLKAHIHSNPSFIRPERMKNFILNRLEDPLEDLCVSRSTFKWGVPVPNDPDHVMYVWFDALNNYVTALDICDENSVLKHFWENTVHIIGVDIVWFHTVIWPCILMSCDLTIPKTVFCHGFVNDKNGDKMSKSVGNVVDPFEILEFKEGEPKYDADTVRFFLLQVGTYGDGIKFDVDAMRERHDSILVHNFGNLVHRCTNLTKKNCGASVPDVPLDQNLVTEFDLDTLREDIEICFGDFNLSEAVMLVLGKLGSINKYLVEREPWKMKNNRDEQASVIRTCLEAVYALAHFMEPFTPRAASQVFEDFGTPRRYIRDLRPDLLNLEPGTPVKVGPLLFQALTTRFETLAAKGEIIYDGKGQKGRIHARQKKKATGGSKKNKAKKNSTKMPLERIEFVVGKIVSLETHTTQGHLYVERIDIGGSDGTIQVVSGLANHYTPEELVGSLVVVFKNLKNSKFRGVRSEGMVMCACNEDKTSVEVLRPPEGAAVGERVTWSRQAFSCDPDEKVDIKSKQKKLWAEVSPLLRTNTDGVMCFDGDAFTTSAGVVRCSRNVDSQIS